MQVSICFSYVLSPFKNQLASLFNEFYFFHQFYFILCSFKLFMQFLYLRFLDKRIVVILSKVLSVSDTKVFNCGINVLFCSSGGSPPAVLSPSRLPMVKSNPRQFKGQKLYIVFISCLQYLLWKCNFFLNSLP